MTLSPGMGALPGPNGTTFRVWAPHAEGVEVLIVQGEGHETHALAHEDGGYWAGFVEGAGPGDEYKFMLQAGGETLYRNDPYAMQMTNSVGNGVIVDHAAFDWQGDEFELPPHNELVIYELHIGSFLTGEGGGSFEKALEKLNHLKRLGVNAIQIMPVAEFAGDMSWGYNPAHIFAVESGYGGPEGLKTFVREAHKAGIAVILDVVYNHFGPSDLDLWQFDGWSENGKGGIYFYQDERSNTPWGDTRPDYGRPEVRQFIRDNALMWLRDYHLDGLRMDMTLYIRTISGNGDDIGEGWSLLQWVNDEARSLGRRTITIAEDLRTTDALTADSAAGGAGFHAQWDANFVHPVREAVVTIDDANRSMAALRAAIEARYNGDAFQRVIYSESHDEVANGRARVPHDVDGGDNKGWFAQKRSTLAAALVFTAPGIPMIFQGQEFLQGEWFQDDVPLDWELSESFSGILRLYRDLIRLRRNWNDATRGLRGQHVTVSHCDDADNILAFHRSDQGGPGDDVMVVMNFADAWREARIGFPAGGHWRLALNSDARIYSPDFGDADAFDVTPDDMEADGMPVSTQLTLAPYSFLIYARG